MESLWHLRAALSDPIRKLAPWLLLSTLLLGACSKPKGEGDGSKGAPSAAPTTEALPELRLVYHSPNTLDWATGIDKEGLLLASNLYEGLTVQRADGEGTRRGLAKGIEVGADGRTWMFQLRDDARWSDGTPVTAEDLIAGWRRCIAPDSRCSSLGAFRRIEGAAAIIDGQAEVGAKIGVDALDDHALLVRLTAPYPLFEEALASVEFLPVPRQVLARVEPGQDWTSAEHGAWNGPWKLASYESGVGARLVPNPQHRAHDDLKISGVRVTFVGTHANGDDLFRSGKADVVYGMVPIERIRELRAARAPALQLWPVLCTYYLAVNTRRAPTNELALREALFHAIDRETLCLRTLGMGQIPATRLIPSSLAETAELPTPSQIGFDPARARAAFAQVPKDKLGERPLELLFNASVGHRLIAGAVREDLRKTLGLEVQLQALEWATLLERMRSGDYDLARLSWCASMPDPLEFLQGLRAGDEGNAPGYSSPDFDAWLERASQSTEALARASWLGRAEAQALRDKPMIPLYFYTRALLSRPCVRGLTPNALEVQRYEQVDLSACQ